MRKDIEKQFLKAYKFGGVVHDCIEVLRYRFNLGYMPNAYNNLSDLMKKHYDEILPNRIKVITEAFDESVITMYDCPLIEEISNNLLEFKTIQEKEHYIHSLIVPFKELSDLLYPELAIKKRIDNELFENEKDRKYWSDIKDFKNVIINDKTLTTKQAKKLVNDNLQAINDFTIEKKEQYDRLNMISKRFHEIIRKPNNEVEKTLSKFNKLKFMFANRLDALCLENKIDFIYLQNEVEIYLKHRRRIEDIYAYIGSWELTEKYINELHIQKNDKEPIQQTKEKSQIPPPQLTKKIKIDVQDYLFIKLKEKGFIPNNTNYYHFCFVFGCTPIPANEQPFKPIKWIKSKQTLRMLLFCGAIRNDLLKPCEIEEKTRYFFNDKNNKPFKLSKNKEEKTTYISRMEHILNNIPTM